MRRAGRYAEATTYLQQAIVLLGQLHDIANQAIARMNLGIVYIHQDEAEQALALFSLAAGVFRQVGDHLHLAMAYNNLTVAYRMLEEWEAALANGEQGVRLWEALGDAKSLVNTLSELGLAYLSKGDNQSAIDTFQRAVKVLEEVPPGPIYDALMADISPHLEEARQRVDVSFSPSTP
jgi:tetratricopeptide (TPR) repeat protein